MAHPTTARRTAHNSREAIGDHPVTRRDFDESKSFALGNYEPSALQANWADFQLLQSLPEDVENG